MQIAISIREGSISSSVLLRRLRSGSRRNATYAAFREVGQVIRTVQLLRFLSDGALRRRVTAATNKVEAFNNFCQWLFFGKHGVIADNDPDEQEKTMKFNALLSNCVIFHTTLDTHGGHPAAAGRGLEYRRQPTSPKSPRTSPNRSAGSASTPPTNSACAPTPSTPTWTSTSIP